MPDWTSVKEDYTGIRINHLNRRVVFFIFSKVKVVKNYPDLEVFLTAVQKVIFTPAVLKVTVPTFSDASTVLWVIKNVSIWILENVCAVISYFLRAGASVIIDTNTTVNFLQSDPVTVLKERTLPQTKR